MRKAIWLGLLVLAACDENTGWNPNYVVADRPYGAVLDSTTSYARYKYDRERALIGRAEVPRTIPRVRPFEAPKPAEIWRPSIVVAEPKLPEAWRSGAAAARPVAATTPQAATAPPVATVPATTLPVTSSGPYPGSTPVLARYALAATHAPGTTLWPRPDPDPDLAARTCRSHASADAAQIAFIAKGGPEADPARMDPDGDGFVCGWNPEPWRQGRRP